MTRAKRVHYLNKDYQSAPCGERYFPFIHGGNDRGHERAPLLASSAMSEVTCEVCKEKVNNA